MTAQLLSLGLKMIRQSRVADQEVIGDIFLGQFFFASFEPSSQTHLH